MWILVILVLQLIFLPLGLIWAVNTLFGTGIDYTFWTWLAATLLADPFIHYEK